MIEIEGLDEFRAALRQATDAMPAEMTKALKAGSVLLRDRARQHTPRGPRSEGKLPASFQVFSRARSAGFRSTLAQAGVFEFAHAYKRSNRSGDGSHTVHLASLGETPRFGYKALFELEEQLVTVAFDALVEVAKAHGWFVEG